MSATPASTLADPKGLIADLRRQLAERTAERDEALAQQTATTEVLQVINASPGNLAPVFDAMLEKATRLCEAAHGHLATYDGKFFRFVAAHGETGFAEGLLAFGPRLPEIGHTWSRIVGGMDVVHVPDVGDSELYRSGHAETRRFVDVGGGRTLLTVALRKDNVLRGTLTVYRQEVRPFSDQQIALMQNFAAQAVVAIENARLITETREALEQQTATAEVLQVINSSPGDLAPVFDAMLEKAHSLCGIASGALEIWDGTRIRALATRGLPGTFEEIIREGYEPGPQDPHWQLLNGAPFVHIHDQSAIDEPTHRKAVELGGFRTFLGVALRKDDVLLGRIVAARQEVRPFSDKEIALLQNFAAQAVIAMENARLITETREALEQQTATAEVLQVINSSPGNLAPVFDAMLAKAMHLCKAAFGTLLTYDGESFAPAASCGVPAALAEWQKRRLPIFGPGTAPARVVSGENLVHTVDLMATEAYQSGDPSRRALVDLGGARTHLIVALRKDSALLGTIAVYRQEVRPFSDKQVALVQNFAAQAVIAMENARLITETREALEQQTATAEVLGVINSSPGDLAPVFGAMLEKATRLCEAPFGILRTWDGECFHFGAVHGEPRFRDWVRQRGPIRPDRDASPLGRILAGERIVRFADVPGDEGYRTSAGFRDMAEASGIRSAIWIALHKDDALLGTITVYRQEVRPFSDKQIALLQNFAAQAVIAIENARLLTETREALEQQTATAEVLQVINSSPGDLAPVFDAILEKAHTLCGVAHGALVLNHDDNFHAVAVRAYSEAFAERLQQGFRGSENPVTRPLIDGDRFVHIPDLAQIDHPVPQAAAKLSGVHTALFVPLRKEDSLLGMISSGRLEIRPFSEKEIALLESFAVQAVIAMDNARLLNEIRQAQAELRVTFDNMGDGVAMFDGEQHLAAWNLNFQRILDLPDALLAERPSYPDYIRFLAKRGEFGAEGIAPELSARLEATDQELRLERTRPDGRVIEIRRNAVPDGGFVTIYSDITERKRAEEEIRDARDTAERALQELKTTQASLLHAQKMAALGQLTAGIAHEIKNPLNFVNNFAGLSVELLDELKETAAPAIAGLAEDERADIDDIVGMLTGNLEKIAEHGRRADGIVKSMLEHSRGGPGERREVDLNGLVEEALNLAYHGARAQDQNFNITLERDFAQGIAHIELVPQDMTRVLLNLFGNGFYAATKRRHDSAEADFRPTLKVATQDLGDAVEIRIRDNGIGIPADIKDKLFQPFFTTKPTGEGTGLGLSISYDIVTQQHGGTITADSELDTFTEFTVRLPRH